MPSLAWRRSVAVEVRFDPLFGHRRRIFMLQIDLLVKFDQRGVVQLAGDLIEHFADFRRQAGFAHQRHHVLAWLFMLIILQDYPILFCEVALSGDDRGDVDFAVSARTAQAVMDEAGEGVSSVKSAGSALANSALTSLWLVASVLPS